MYERNAIVLERYFYGIFDFKNSSNLKENYYNYRKLFECYGSLCRAKKKEEICKKEFDEASAQISKLQKSQEKLYNKSAKFEYSRYIIFSNINEKTDSIEKHLNKVNDDVQKNNDELKELGEKFVQAVIDYNEKESNLREAISEKEKAQKEYDEIYERAKKCYDEITEEQLDIIRSFIKSDNKENRKALQEIFDNNGKDEKNPFDLDVISNTISKSFEIYKIEVDIYLAGYDRISKLFEEIENDSVKIDKHSKYYRDSKAKLDFLSAEKNYIVQFLDNERIGAIYDKKTHRKLMLESCKKFVLDFAQIEKLYDIILKEVAGRSTKKIYKENYNREYLTELENSSIEPSLDTGKMRQQAIAFVNLNYWRASGMQSIYAEFEEIVKTIYDRDISEYMPKEPNNGETKEEFIENLGDLEEKELVEEVRVKEKIKPRCIYYSSKISLANAIYNSLQNREFAASEECDEYAEETSFGKQEEEKYEVPENVKAILSSVEEKEKIEKSELSIKEQDRLENDILNKLDELEDNENLEENNLIADELFEEGEESDVATDRLFEEDEEEDSILEIYFNQDDKKSDGKENTTIDNLNKKVGLFQKLVGFNSKKKKEA